MTALQPVTMCENGLGFYSKPDGHTICEKPGPTLVLSLREDIRDT